jgi:transglutaminase-like putative cysteine protease
MLIRRGLLSLVGLIVYTVSGFADWRPIDPADLALKRSKVDANADAEALFREVYISNEQQGLSYPRNIVREYVRLKIFTERGKELANVTLPYFRNETIFDVQGRTIHPDGSIAELTKASIFSKVIDKRGFQTKVITFALPAVEPGSIVEYRFTKNEGERTNRYQPLEVQSEYPVDELTFFIRPLSSIYVSYPAMRYYPFGCAPERGQATREGFDVLKVKNVPSFHDEPFSPPRYSARQWILVYYEENSKSGKDQYWTSLGKEIYGEYSHEIKVNGDVKALAAEITAGVQTDEEKLDKILKYCRTELKDIGRDEIATETREASKINKNTADTLRRKQGTTRDINYVFIALAQAAGFDARRAELSDRSTFLFGPAMQSRYFLNAFDIAVKLGDRWRFYDVTNPALAGGQLRWQEQGVYALISDGKHPEMVQTPVLSAAESMERRIATLSLSEEGALEGDVREIKFGNFASEWRERNRDTNDAQREQALQDELKERFADFTLSNATFTVSSDASKPVGIVYHILIPNYAQRTGKRLFVRPDYFGAGFGSRFTATTRYNNIYFDFPWSEFDSIQLKLPAGFELDHADAPLGVNAPPTCTYGVKMTLNKEQNVLGYERRLTFGSKDLVMFGKEVYPTLKNVFDAMHKSDNHMLTLKAATTASAAR